MFNELDLQPIYDSSEKSILEDLIVRLLTHSVDYYRGVGFFTSGWLRLASRGLAQLVENGGRARIIVSPVLSQSDWQAFVLGEEAKRDALLRDALKVELKNMAEKLETNTLNTLAWLIADELVQFKFAVAKPEYSGGDYHDKVGVFADTLGEEVAIHGSFNDTVKGTLNGEAISVFKSWEPGQAAYVKRHRDRLLKLWNDDNRQFFVYTIPDAIKKQFVQYRTEERPYKLKDTQGNEDTKNGSPVVLRPYQELAIEEWFKNGRRGIYEMATGTGKSFTALATAQKLAEIEGRVALVILVPYMHLLEQWAKDAEKFGYTPVMCSGSHNNWPMQMRSKIEDYNVGALDRICIVAVHPTASSGRFTRLAGRIKNHSMIVADEVHRLGAGKLQQALAATYQYRLGLSATPERWFDEVGTEAIFGYFQGVCYCYDLNDAIENEYLTPYDYHPVLVELSPSEQDKYEELTGKITSLAPQAENDLEIAETLKILLLKRAELIAGAENKLPALLNLLRDLAGKAAEARDEVRHTLVYCPPGKHREVLVSISGLGLRCHEFVHTVSLRDRAKVLADFQKGHIQALVAVKCLDEGVDVPATQTAFVLASSTNPMEYVQRRGRILRRSKGKERALIYDFIVTPSIEGIISDTLVGILRREMPRFVEFSSLASNRFQARRVVREMLDRNGLLDLLDKLPWDIYREAKKDLLNDAE